MIYMRLCSKMGVDMGTEHAKSEQVPSWGVSLPVENVQEIVRKNPSSVPNRYIREHDGIPLLSPDSYEVPVIDLSLLTDENEKELNKLDRACQDWGFFQVINHGVPEEILQNMKDSSLRFFDRPLVEKNKYAMPPNDIQGYGQAYVVSDEQKLDWNDALMLFVYPHSFRKLEYWPKELEDVIETYSAQVRKVEERLLGSLSLIMGIDRDALLDMHMEAMQLLRVNYYPPCSLPDQVYGGTSHSDSGSITILMQDDDVTGLQIRHDGGWLPIEPIPHALVVNIGDVMEIWSNGKYKSIEHRGMPNKEKARMSFGSFMSPNQDVEIEPIDLMVDERQPIKLYERIKFGDYLRNTLKKKWEGKALTETRT